jgi:hypothetical protein
MRIGRLPLSITAVLLFAFAIVLAASEAERTVSGRITAVDTEARTLTVRDPAAGELKLVVDEATAIVLDGDGDATLDDLFEGDDVVSATVRELADGRLYLVKAAVTSQPSPDEGE